MNCLCIETGAVVTTVGLGGAVAMTSAAPAVRVGDAATCRVHGRPLFGMTSLRALDLGHIVSGILVSFARGLNDTPKIAGILLIGTALTGPVQQGTVVAVASVMALGGCCRLAVSPGSCHCGSPTLTRARDSPPMS